MTFQECVVYCAGVPEFVENFDRLQGTKLAQINTRAPIERMIDDACGVTCEDDMRKFTNAVWDLVWCRLPPEAFEQEEANR